jgi:hypothetical protein
MGVGKARGGGDDITEAGGVATVLEGVEVAFLRATGFGGFGLVRHGEVLSGGDSKGIYRMNRMGRMVFDQEIFTTEYTENTEKSLSRRARDLPQNAERAVKGLNRMNGMKWMDRRS